MKRRFMRWVIVSAVVGLVVSLTLLSPIGPSLASGLGLFPDQLMLAVWPSSILLLATSGFENTLQGYFAVASSVATNILLYAIVGAVLCGLKQLAAMAVRR